MTTSGAAAAGGPTGRPAAYPTADPTAGPVPVEGGAPSVDVRYWAAARDAAGTTEERLPAVTTLAQLLAGVGERHGERLARLLPVCSYLVDGDPVGRRPPAEVRLRPGAVVEVLPPFAGG